MFSVLVLNCCRPELSRQTIERLLEATTLEHELILIDNNSGPKLQDYLKDAGARSNAIEVKYVFNKSNLGISRGRNAGLKMVNPKSRMVALFDDDIWVPDGWDLMAQEAFDRVKNLGLSGLNVEGKQYPLKEISGVKLQIKKGNIGGGSIMLSRKALATLGFFDPFMYYGGEDCELYNRARKAGFVIGYLETPGKHLDTHKNKAYRKLKQVAHKDPKMMEKVGARELYVKKTRKFYVEDREVDLPDAIKFDKAIRGKNGK